MPDLAGIRKSRGIPLTDIAAATRINLRYLAAIEQGEIHKLPGLIYTRSYVRQYARAIDYDEDDLLARFGLAPEEEHGVSGAALGTQGPFVRLARLLSAMLNLEWNRTPGGTR